MKYITDSATKIVIIPGEIELSPKAFQVFNRTRQAAKYGKDLRNSWEYPPTILPIVRKYFLMMGNVKCQRRIEDAMVNMDWDFSINSVNTWSNLKGKIGVITYNGNRVEGDNISIITLLCFGGRV